MVIPLIVVLSVPSLMWFGHHWTIGNDAPRYLLAASDLISGQGIQIHNGLPFNGGHGPGFPALIGSLIVVFGRDTESLAWAVRLLALVNPLLAYFLAKRISSPVTGLIAAALLTLFGFNAEITPAFNIDAPLLTFYLLALLTLLTAIERRGSLLALLSGLLLAVSILTKETAFANLPLALLAVLLLNWNVRGALWHYLGVVLVCLPWWIWAYSATGQVYLLDRLPTSLQVPVLIASAIFVAFATVAYASRMADRFLANERWRRWSGWFVVVAWTVSLSGMLLTTATPALATLSFEVLSFEELRRYLAHLQAPSIVIACTLLMGVGYMALKAVREGMAWRLVALALLFQVPICLLVAVESWAPRQLLIPQTLLFCALATLIANAGEAALRGRGYSARLTGAVVAAPLVILLLVASVEKAQALLPENPDELSKQRRVAPQATEMIDWMAKNIPEGKNILVTPAYALNRYLMFLDGGRHEWSFLRLDQEPCTPKPNIQIRCNFEKNALSRIPPDAVWVHLAGECKAISLSMSNLLEQVRRTRSGYVMISGDYALPGILELSSHLEESSAFEIVHTELDHDESSSKNRNLVLLRSTGRAPKAVPTLMNANTLPRLKRCEQAEGLGYAERIRSTFSSGISVSH